MADAPHDAPAPRDTPPHGARPLDYFASHAPDAPTRPGLSIAWIMLCLGWLPSVCGVVNALSINRSGMREVIDAHQNAAILFSALGLLSIVASIVLFVRRRDGYGLVTAILSLLIATGMAGCVVALRRH